jgi:hypothetical protein
MAKGRFTLLALAAVLLVAVWRASRANDAEVEPVEQLDELVTSEEGMPDMLGLRREDERAPAAELGSGSRERDAAADLPRCSEPREAIDVMLSTPEGEPYTKLAGELGLDPRTAFAGGFRAWETNGLLPRDAPPPGAMTERGDNRFRAYFSPSHWSIDPRTDTPVGVFELGHWRECSIALYFHQRFLGWCAVPPSAKEARFEIGLDDLRAALSSLSLRVI